MGVEQTYSGVIVPMVSPFKDDCSVDTDAVKKLAEHLVSNRTIPFALGTTGEGSSMSEEQKRTLVETLVKAVKGRSPVFAGISSNSLEVSVELAKIFADKGADAVVATTPHYYPLEHEYMLRYFEELAERIPLPLILYNMPLTTGVSIPLEIADKLSRHPNIAGIKDSERDAERLDRSLECWASRRDFAFLPGWAPMSVYALKRGADGIVPSTANLVPELYHQMYTSVMEGDIKKAKALQDSTDYISLLYQKDRRLNLSLPALKVLLSIHGLCQPYVLPPLYRMDTEEENRYRMEMEEELKNLMPG